MKKLVICFTTALLISSCGNNAEKNASTEPQGAVTDSKSQEKDIERAKKEMLDSVNLSTIRQRTIDSMNAVSASRVVEPHGTTHHTTVHHPAGTTAPVTSSNPQTQAPVTTPQTSAPSSSPVAASTPTTEKKKGLSNAVKGSLIGVGTGAAAGAIIDKNHRGEGAIIGGVTGAVGGALGGALIDRNKRKKAAEQARQDSIDRANGTIK